MAGNRNFTTPRVSIMEESGPMMNSNQIAETSVQVECRLLRILMNGMPNMAWIQGVKEPSGFWNAKVDEYFGANNRSLDPIDWSRVIHPDDLDRAMALWVEMLKTGAGYNSPVRLKRIDGTFRWLSVQVFPIYDDAGELTHIGGTMNDIHELEESRSRMEQLQIVANALSGEISLKDAAELVVNKGCFALGASAGIFCQLSKDKTRLDIVYEQGKAASDNEVSSFALNLDLPVPASFLLKESIFFETREQRVARFPGVCPFSESSKIQGLIAIPIVVDSQAVGVIVFDFKNPLTIDSNLKSFSIALAGQCAQAIARAKANDFERETLELKAENEARLRLALDASEIGLWEWDFATGRQWVAGRYSNVFGYDVLPDGWDIRDVMSHCHPDDQPLLQLEIDRFQDSATDSPFRFRTFRFVTPAGKTVWIQSVGSLLRNDAGTPVKSFGVMMNVTYQRDTEIALNRAKEEAEAADRAKTSFVANMSHEFRTPLTAILGFAEFLSRESLTSDKRVSYTEGIRRNGQVLLKLVEDILDLSRVEAGRVRFDLQMINPQALIEDVVDIFKEEIDKKNLDLELDGLKSIPSRFVSDPIRLRQIFVNVIGNAVKFTDQGRITVSAKCREIASISYLEVTVKDTGIGLSPSQFDRLFQAFGQAETSVRRKFGGTGLGLFISRGLARALGGEIELLKSEPGVGSSFIVRIADQKEQSHAAGEATEVEPRKNEKFSGQRVLLVEDTEDLREFLGAYLREVGCEVDYALDGQEAIDRITAGSDYDTILMDLHMPRLDGYSATAKLREMGCGIPIVAITARNLPEDRLRCFEIGFDGFMTKPLSLRDLESTLRRMFRRRKPVQPKSV